MRYPQGLICVLIETDVGAHQNSACFEMQLLLQVLITHVKMYLFFHVYEDESYKIILQITKLFVPFPSQIYHWLWNRLFSRDQKKARSRVGGTHLRTAELRTASRRICIDALKKIHRWQQAPGKLFIITHC